MGGAAADLAVVMTLVRNLKAHSGKSLAKYSAHIL